MGYIFFSVVFLVIAVVCFLRWNKLRNAAEPVKPDASPNPRLAQRIKASDDLEFGDVIKLPALWFWIGMSFLILWVIMTISCGTYKVDGGEARMLLQFGRPYYSDSEAGLSFARPWATFVTWKSRLESFEDSIEARTSDEMIMHIDISIWWAVDTTNLEDVYNKIARNYEDLKTGFVTPGVRSAVRDEIGKTTFSEVLTNRDKYGDSITKYVAETLKSKHIVIDKIIIRNVTPPSSVNEAIELRMKSQQMKEQMEFELDIAKKKADIRRAEAQGVADAQTIIQRTLTPIYVQYEAIQAMKDLVGSPNTTFVFVPMSSGGAGVPMILNAPIK